VIAASIFTEFWDDLVDHGEQDLFLVLVGFVLSFAFIRMSTRIIRSESVSWWPGNIESEGGLHVHHLVFGIVSMMVFGALGFAFLGSSPGSEICAFGFGVGLGLTIDEFALWVHLDDVYWAEEGRSSIDATVIAAALMLLVLLGFTPFSFDTGSPEEILFSVLGALLVFAMVAICFAKQRLLHGIIGFLFLPVAIYGAARIGKPGSPWARRRYGERRPGKQAKAADRFQPDRRTERFKNAFRDIVGGKPSEGMAAAGAEALAATREAVDRVTHPGTRDRD
jgi:lysyl-tRNA synthetase class 2